MFFLCESLRLCASIVGIFFCRKVDQSKNSRENDRARYTVWHMKDETLRLLHERCLLAAKKEQTDTGFIQQNEKIAVYDNFLFCLALFRSKTHENVLEARKLLERLLYFQQLFTEVANYGNYPLHISDYPHCNDHLQALRCITVKLWIYKEFSQILGPELKARLENSMQKLIEFLVRINKEVKFPFWAKCKLAQVAICMKAQNAHFDISDLELPDVELPDLADTSDLRTWGDPFALAELISAYQLAPSDKWKPFWHYLSRVWHVPSKQYAGPAYKLGFQHPHLLAAMALFSQSLEKSVACPLYCALLTDENELEQLGYPFIFEGLAERFKWTTNQFAEHAYSTLCGRPSPENSPGFFGYYLVSGIHSFAIGSPFGFSSDKLVFEIDAAVFAEEKEKAKALVLSFNDHPHNKVLVLGQKATCFNFSDPLQLTLGKQVIKLAFTRLSGDGEFVGHIIRGNRSGHCQERYNATDVQIFLRALRGTVPTSIKVELEFLTSSNVENV